MSLAPRPVTVRRLSQGLFLTAFLWFCVVSSIGTAAWQLRGWPVNWFLQIDPLVAIGTALSTWTLPEGLPWALLTITLTLVLGRVFCGWICPFGAMQQVVGWLGRRTKAVREQIAVNAYHPAQRLKYAILAVFLAGAAAGILQTGLLDPIPLAQRSVNLAVLAVADRPAGAIWVTPRVYAGGFLIGGAFLVLLFMSLKIPRFFCRFLCPLGALLGMLSRLSLWRVGKAEHPCVDCHLCDANCEGACSPAGNIRPGECLVCMNCFEDCAKHRLMRFSTEEPAGGQIEESGLSRRAFLASVAAGLAAGPLLKLTGRAEANWDPAVIRPPGAVTEEDFLGLCIKCGQCMRVCPTNVLQPAGFGAGAEKLWTPLLNNRIGTSGCQLNCVACGNLCPTGAIRPLTLDEKLGRGEYRDAGPVRIGTAFVDRGRCLPWATDRPCIVCEENCPVTPKAIHVEKEYRTVRDGDLRVAGVSAGGLRLAGRKLETGALGTGDYYVAHGNERLQVVSNTSDGVEFGRGSRWKRPPRAGTRVRIQVKLQKPKVDMEKCIGCGVCEHECPVDGLRAIRVTAENETRTEAHSVTL